MHGVQQKPLRLGGRNSAESDKLQNGAAIGLHGDLPNHSD